MIGEQLGPYQILEEIGAGGMAMVYKAYQPATDLYVAVKVISANVARDPTSLERFRREARAVAQLEHAHILPVYNYGEVDGRPYLVMRYLDGGSLADLLASRPPSIADAGRIVAQVGSALDYAHRQGVVHRDVKPANILIDQEGNSFLTDFGVARMMEATVRLTNPGLGVGTPTYMSPEQAQGLAVDGRADIYSLGVMLFEMVTGQVPYYAETPVALLFKHVREPLPEPRKLRPDLPPEIERVILRAMAKDPASRYQNAGDMVSALNSAMMAAGGAALRTPPVQPVASPAADAATLIPRPRRWATWLLAVVAVTLFVLSILFALHMFGLLGIDP